MASKPIEDSALDYFISYTGVDEEWAVWIAWQIEAMGHKTIIRAWDFKKGENFVSKMQEAITQAKKTIAILSPEYLVSDSPSAEWAAAFALDPTGKDGLLIPIKIKPVDSNKLGLLTSIITIDLTGLSSKEDVKIRLWEKIKASQDGRRNKPEDEPPFPMIMLNGSETNQKQTCELQSSESKANVPTKKKVAAEDGPEFKAGLIDKFNQAEKIITLMDNDLFVNEEKSLTPLAFLLYGADRQWPQALNNILYLEIKSQLKKNSRQKKSPDIVQLDEPEYRSNITPKEYLYKLIADKLSCPSNDESISDKLAKTVPSIFYRRLWTRESENPQLIQGMLAAWEKVKYSNGSPRHILILFYAQTDKPASIWSRWLNKNPSLIDKINKTLPRQIRENQLLPKLESPDQKRIGDWIHKHFIDSETENVKDFVKDEIRNKHEECKKNRSSGKKQMEGIRITKNDFEIHHHDLKSILISALAKFEQPVI
jgi:hypothetical protein